MAQPAVSRESAPRQQLHQTSAGSMSHAAALSKAQLQQEAIAEASSKLLAADATDQGATCKGRSRTARQRRGAQIADEGQVAAAKPSRPRRQAAGSTKMTRQQSSGATSISSSIPASGSAAAGAGATDCAQHSRKDLGSTGAPAKESRPKGAAACNVMVAKQQHSSSTSSSSTLTSCDVAAFADPIDKDSGAPASDYEQPPEQLTVGKPRRPAARQTGRTASSKAAAGTSRQAVKGVTQEQRPACQQAAASKAAVSSNSILPATSKQGCERACLPAAVSPVTQTQPRTRMSR